MLGIERDRLLDQRERLLEAHAAVGVHVAEVVEHRRRVGLDDERLAEDASASSCCFWRSSTAPSWNSVAQVLRARPRAPGAASPRRRRSAWRAGRTRATCSSTFTSFGALAAQLLDDRERARRVALLAQDRGLECREVGVVGEARAGRRAPRRAPCRSPWPGTAPRRDSRAAPRRRPAHAVGPAEGLGGIAVARELLVGEAEVDQEHAVVACRVAPASSPVRLRARIASSRRRPARSPARLGDRHLQVGGLRGPSDPAASSVSATAAAPSKSFSLAQRAALQVEARRRSSASACEHGVGLGQRLLDSGAARNSTSPSLRRTRTSARLDLERLAVVQDRPGRPAGLRRRCRPAPGSARRSWARSSIAFLSAAAACSESPSAR